MRSLLVLLAMLCAAPPAPAQGGGPRAEAGPAGARPRLDPGPAMVVAARSLLGTPYVFGGRLRGAEDGIDCQGVLFYAAERSGGCGWRSFSVYPSRAIPAGELGAPVDGLAPVASAHLDLASLRPGDVLWLVGPARNPAEPAIGTLDARPVWVWHTGLYSSRGQWIVGDHFAGRVVETDLARYLADHADTYSGLVVTRLRAPPRPSRCRRHAPMGPAHRPAAPAAPASRGDAGGHGGSAPGP